MTMESVTDAFGPRVAEMVEALTEDESISDYRVRKAASATRSRGRRTTRSSCSRPTR